MASAAAQNKCRRHSIAHHAQLPIEAVPHARVTLRVKLQSGNSLATFSAV